MDMSIDDLINQALQVNGQHVGATGLLAVVSDVKNKELYLLDLQEFFSENMLHFSKGTTAAVI
ncbi:hypothetical protein [Niabella hibiscisoli]|uniref:hypothetical protein n=1 Tax=Niabella hibiscisoli TaxID=1825928 RepID=UPI001F10E3D5|nr:hypothetical protein [Niabella hibiscisoli]MCH5719109.1 hypothetical protein [Niabella hibiscisoli]